ncbi:hypothetical protein CAPN002_01180 [Capnocytophaga stomatis]|uniref:HNH endonuclease n=1 Tax=Capnocytophaga stomatis TaxID=1848904 RepID=UPI00194E7008|nr:HNH endonuclease [Capnocytophaga stomatis]GIJ92900.1 hypothetical protein CAPN002_01180 [Capnocytophaga stomatis]
MDYGQNGTPDYPRYLWQNSVNTWNWGNKVTIALGQNSLPSEALYDFEKMTLLDDAVYSMLDIFGIIPGVDTFTDPIGAAYALARSDVENAIIYSASAVTPLVGIAYVRGGAKALSKAEPAVALVAKKADNTDGFELVYKSVNDIQANEFYVATSIDGKQSQAFLEQTKKYLDKDAIKKQVDELAKVTNIVVKKSIQDVKKLLANSPDWVKTNTELLEKLTDKSDDFIKKVDDFYAITMKKQTPAGFDGGEKLYGGIWFNKYGFPDFEKMGQTLGKKYNFIGANGNYTDDFTRARDWLKKQNGIEEIKDLRNGSPLLVKIEGKWKKITWHHHEDGKTLIPVFSEIHEKIKHTGGVKTKEIEINNLFNYE